MVQALFFELCLLSKIGFCRNAARLAKAITFGNEKLVNERFFVFQAGQSFDDFDGLVNGVWRMRVEVLF